MGRKPAPWLARAYDMLADGQWRTRERVVAEMSKAVPPGRALRRGQTIKHAAGLPNSELIRRGAAHICLGSLKDSSYLRFATFDDVVMVCRTMPGKGLPEVVTAKDEISWVALGHLAALAEGASPGVLLELGLSDQVLARLHR